MAVLLFAVNAITTWLPQFHERQLGVAEGEAWFGALMLFGGGPGIAATFAVQLVGVFLFTMAVPGIRAGLSDAIPANLRGAGFGVFNLWPSCWAGPVRR